MVVEVENCSFINPLTTIYSYLSTIKSFPLSLLFCFSSNSNDQQEDYDYFITNEKKETEIAIRRLEEEIEELEKQILYFEMA